MLIHQHISQQGKGGGENKMENLEGGESILKYSPQNILKKKKKTNILDAIKQGCTVHGGTPKLMI